jgi:hypothetical protein
MNHGLQKINLFVVLILIFININHAYLNISTEVTVNKAIKDNGIKMATIGILNKITAKVSSVNIFSGEGISIYDLKIYNKLCHISLPEEKPLIAAYLIIEDSKGKNDFSGWMIKDLPSVSSMEHPLYDIWLKNCS